METPVSLLLIELSAKENLSAALLVLARLT